MALPFAAAARLVGGKAIKGGTREKTFGGGLKFRTNSKEFNEALNRAAKELEADIADIVRVTAFKIERKCVERTPVDTGRARASWNISEEYADLKVAPEGNHGMPPPSSGGVKGGAVGGISGKKPIFISNNLEYIVPLEFGHSKQAPNGMAALAIAEVLAELQSISRG